MNRMRHFTIPRLLMEGKGLVNSIINHLPFELHLPGYNYCGPGTRLRERLIRGDKGVNELDEYCKQHDIAYMKSNNLQDRHAADKILMKVAKKRASSSQARIGEKLAANIVNKAMMAKLSHGSGLKKTFKNVVAYAKKNIRKAKPKCKKLAIELAIAAIKDLVSDSEVSIPRVIPLPKTGGFLPLIPIITGLSAAGALVKKTSAIARMVKTFQSARKTWNKMKRLNQTFETVHVGGGLQLKPYKDGLGIYTSSKN